jgi:polysaccharide chain length determinant protein (PEP-CTERM system associated)
LPAESRKTVHDLIVKILNDVRGSWRFRWHALAISWVLALGGWIYIFFVPDVYQATARVYVDTQSALRPLLRGLAIEPDVDSELLVVRTALLSRPRLEQVARETDLDLGASTPEDKQMLITDLQRRITIANDARTPNSTTDGTYRISFQDTSREKSVEVVQKLLSSFVEETLGSKREGQEDAQRFLKEQIAEYERRLSEAETRVADFKKKNVGKMPDDRGDYFQRLQTEMVQADAVRQQLALAQARKEEMTRQLAGEEPFMFGFDADPTSQAAQGGGARGDLSARIQELEHRAEELLLRYTEKHPEIIAVRATIDDLKKQREAELARVRAGQRATGSLSQSLKSNPVYQGIRLEMNRTEVQIAELRRDLGQREGRLTELQRLVNSVPEVEAELARLNRDYEVTRTQYQELVQRLETAKLSEDAQRTGVVSFQVIDPPAALIEPVAPNRMLLLLGVFLLSIGAGVGTAYLVNMIRPVFYDERTLSEQLGLPVLGAVSHAWVEQTKVRERTQLIAFSMGGALLAVVFAFVLVMREPVAHALARIAG